ncbi:MAG: UDP-N-acetylmuramoyl-L-alanine--D-glutamate ligase [Streptosporangiales bacterium]|nr:UDP-N-acetylmuramoyl-L-alanine--D-glutamate ligase [Streptosporangiales bacterium]
MDAEVSEAREPSAGWEGLPVCVAGIGVSGVPAARALLRLGARVTVVDARDGEAEGERANELRALGAAVRLGDGDTLPDDTRLVVTSPGWRPQAPLPAAARAAGIPVIGEVELAWRVQPRNHPAWLALTGTNGKTTTVEMLAAMLKAAGHRTAAVGNVGFPLIDAVLADPPYQVLAVELSSFQLHWSTSVRPYAAAVLNVAPDHLDWHGSLDAYAADKKRIFCRDATNVFNADDEWSTRLAAGFPETVGFALGEPRRGRLGVADGMLVDRAFGVREGEEHLRRAGGVELASRDDVRPPAPHNMANALAAAALARAYGVPAAAVREGLRAFVPDSHRIAHVANVHGVDYVDDSKATNPHAAAASLSAYPSVVWVAGGQLKGAPIDDLVARSASRLSGTVLLGVDRARIREALRRHAPDVPVVEVSRTDTESMDTAVREAARLARPGDTVLLAPAAASLDMFDSYAVRGDAFAAAVRRMAEEPGEGR